MLFILGLQSAYMQLFDGIWKWTSDQQNIQYEHQGSSSNTDPLLRVGGWGGVVATPPQLLFYSINVFAFNTLKAWVNLQFTRL